MKINAIFRIFLLLIVLYSCSTDKTPVQYSQYDDKIDSLLKLMTDEEKVGQLNVVNYWGDMVNPAGTKINIDSAIAQGLVCGIQNIRGVKLLTKLQKIAVHNSRLGIPLLFPSDIIHGTEVVFPIPLAQASSWDMDAIQDAARIAANEATALGIDLTYSPMADISRDPRWGRVMEGGGEDPYFTSKMTAAIVKGYQGDDLSDPTTMGSCIKHFAAYGAVEGGRDYNIVDMSDRRLREIYLPGYKAGIYAGASAIMVSFNEINGVPSSCNSYLLKNILRKEWGFEGFVIGDYSSVGELVNHGVASDLKEAAELAINAGLDIDMASLAILNNVPELVKEGKVSKKTLDEAVKHVLRIKYALGIMDHPFLYLNGSREKNDIFKPEYLAKARSLAQKSIVLLKNKDHILPLKKDINKLALIGPFAQDRFTPKGEWAFGGNHYGSIVTLAEGIGRKVSNNTQILYAKGCNANDDSVQYIESAVNTAKMADVVVVAIGEPLDMIGESTSRTTLNLPGMQMNLIKELKKTGKPIVALIFSGRPLLLNWLDKNIDGIVQVWHLGHESGDAIADVVFGDYNPSGKLTLSFPYNEGQIPVYYSCKTTGRPFQENYRWCSHYIDNPNTPLYPFGYGLSYSTFRYSEIELSKNKLGKLGSIEATVKIKNLGPFNGDEIVQLYIQDLKGSVTRPVKELKGFKRISLKVDEEKTVSFNITVDDLRFYTKNMKYEAEPGEFKVYIGNSSDNVKEAEFTLR